MSDPQIFPLFFFLTPTFYCKFSVINKSYSPELGCLKFSINLIFRIHYSSDQITSLPWLCFMGRTETFAVYVALGDTEMLRYALKSILRGEKKCFVQVWSILLRSVFASPRALRLSLTICFLTDSVIRVPRGKTLLFSRCCSCSRSVLYSVFCLCSSRVQRARPFSCHAFCFQAPGKCWVFLSINIFTG